MRGIAEANYQDRGAGAGEAVGEKLSPKDGAWANDATRIPAAGGILGGREGVK